MLDYSVLSRLCAARDMLRQPDTLSAAEVARTHGFSVYHFTRLYKAVFGQSPYQCLLDRKLKRAAFLLVTTDRPVAAIAYELGFASLGSFSTQFAKKESVSPSRYRKRFAHLPRSRNSLPSELQPGCISLMTAALASTGPEQLVRAG